jgi:uncharacterized delta-60 repeat protein
MTRPVLLLAPLIAGVDMLAASHAPAATGYCARTPCKARGARFLLLAGLLASDCAVALPDGYFDPAFPGSGRFAFDGDSLVPGNESRVGAIALESNGNLFLGGPAIGTKDYWWLGELTGNGQFVSSFGANNAGRITSCQLGFSCATNNTWRDSALATPGTYLALANSLALTNQAANSVNTSVSNPVTVNDASGWVVFNTTAVQADGKILAAGKGFYSVSDTKQRFGVARFTGGLASIDHGFNAVTDDGGVTFDGGVIPFLDPADAYEGVGQILVRPDGRIVLVGFGVDTVSNASKIELVQLNADGSLDMTFGSKGVAEPKVYSSLTLTEVHAILDRAGRLFVVAAAGDDTRMRGTMIGTNGSPLWSLNDLPTGCVTAFAKAAAEDSAGRVLMGGTCHDSADFGSGHYYFVVVRYHGDTGQKDSSFGINSVSLGWYDDTSTADLGNALVFDSGGRPVIAGATQIFVKPTAGVARLTYDLVYTNNFEDVPRGCLPPECN